MNRRTFALSRCMMPTPLGWGADDRVGCFDGTGCRNFGEVDGVGLAGLGYCFDYALNYSFYYSFNWAIGIR